MGISFEERRFRDLSKIDYKIEYGLIENPKLFVLRLSFIGEAGEGSGGNNNSSFMAAVTRGAIGAWHTTAVIFDFSNLNYVFGDSILGGYEATKNIYKKYPPVAIITSKKNINALSSLFKEARGIDPNEVLVETIDASIEMIIKKHEMDERELEEILKKRRENKNV